MEEITRDAADRFVLRFISAWVENDADSAAALYSEDYVYRWDPLEAPVVGRDDLHEYWAREGALQSQVDVRWREPMIRGLSIAFEIWATMRYEGQELSDPGSGNGARAEARDVTTMLCYVADFAADGLCSEMREYRFVLDGCLDAPAGYSHRLTQPSLDDR